MNEQIDLSVVISTYNRCDLLPSALRSVLAQETGGARYEVIVVDNNSTDRTREVVESFIARGAENLRYIFEEAQGLSHARNTGIANARAPIISFTDDDILAAQDWVRNIKRTFDDHPEVDFVGGKVLPRWNTDPPAWLTREHWSPLAIVDYGDAPFYVNAEKPLCMVGANLSVRRKVFERIGLFTSNLQRVKDSIGSTEDYELHMRIWAAGGQGMYVPDIVVSADVQANRLTKAYHRRWHKGQGKYRAIMGLEEITAPDGRLMQSPMNTPTLFGASAFMYRQVIASGGRWVIAVARRNESLSLYHENKVRYLISYIRRRYEQNATERKRSSLAEIGSFTKALIHKKMRLRRGNDFNS